MAGRFAQRDVQARDIGAQLDGGDVRRELGEQIVELCAPPVRPAAPLRGDGDLDRAPIDRVGSPSDEAMLLEHVDSPARGRVGRVHAGRELVETQRADDRDLDQRQPLGGGHRLVVLDAAADSKQDRVEL